MKSVAVFDMRDFDEAEWFEKYSQELGLTLSTCPDAPDMENIARVTEGCECVDIITSQITREMMEEFAKSGIRYITTRTIGYDHIDLEAAKEFGIHVGNAPYGPNGVADYTVMLILMSIRKMKRILERTNIQDYDLYENEEVKEHASYVPLKELWKEADVITLHTPLTEENHYLINKESLAEMKDGVVIINTARGALIESEALIAGIESGKVGAAALDVVEKEFGLYYYDRKSDVLDNRELAILRGFPNVTVSHHMAFYTDNYTRTVVRDSLQSCKLFMEGKKNPWEVC